MDIADATLAELDMRGVFFVNLRGVEESNVDLVFAASPRPVGRERAAGTPPSTAARTPPERGSARRRLPSTIIGVAARCWSAGLETPVLASPNSASVRRDEKQQDPRKHALDSSGICARLGAGPSARQLRGRIGASRSAAFESRANGAGLTSCRNWRPRAPPAAFGRRLQAGENPSPGLGRRSRRGRIDRRILCGSPRRNGQTSALVWLGGTERWKDASVNVALATPQGAILGDAAEAGLGTFLRFGVNSTGRAVLQKSSQMGRRTRSQLAKSAAAGLADAAMIGSRAQAAVNGQPIMDRPAEIHRAWSKVRSRSRCGASKARPSRAFAVSRPIRFSCARALAASPDEASVSELRRRADELSILSPRAAPAGQRRRRRACQPGRGDFARYHRSTSSRQSSRIAARRLPRRHRLVEAATRAPMTAADGVNLLIAPSSGNEGGARAGLRHPAPA